MIEITPQKNEGTVRSHGQKKTPNNLTSSCTYQEIFPKKQTHLQRTHLLGDNCGNKREVLCLFTKA